MNKLNQDKISKGYQTGERRYRLLKDEMEAEKCDCMHEHKHLREQILREMPDEEELAALAEFFKVFGDVTRVRILCTLLRSEMCVCDLAQVLNMTQSAISHQLRMLKQMALVKNRREGKTVFYSLSDGHIVSILSQGMEHIEE